jgi:hypothetical protein
MVSMDVDLASLHKILKDPTRRNIVLHLSKKGQLAYVELMNILEITNTGKINYHLKMLGNLIEKGEDGKYRLTERGQLASQMLEKFPEKTVEAKSLPMTDALLIGIAGSLLLFAFPVLFVGLPVLGLVGSLFSVYIYELSIPGAMMWWLTIRRAKSHDFYDLFKPPLVPIALIIAWLVLTLLLHASFTMELSNNGSSAQITMIGFVILGFFPFIGVIITECLYRVLKRDARGQ